MTAAECARRTGITVKALRVYERHGLIKPARSGKGWRLYGPQELLRLNAIAALKSLGLTLAQIREVRGTSPPPLERVMRMRRDAWRARRDAADKALDLVDAALVRIGNRQSLSIDDLCDLLRNLEMDTVKSISRDLFTGIFTLDESFDTSRAIAMEFRKLLELRQMAPSRRADAGGMAAPRRSLADRKTRYTLIPGNNPVT
jgi:DNA-binding transcriptional MerR regulator